MTGSKVRSSNWNRSRLHEPRSLEQAGFEDRQINANNEFQMMQDLMGSMGNPMEMALPESGSQVYLLGLWYVDEYRRTEQGWRISRREEEKSWVFNVPDFMDL